MVFDSFSAFLLMDGHGPYVWTCYGAFFLLTGLIAWQSLRERRRVVQNQQRQQTLASSGQAQRSEPPSGGGFQRIPSTQSESVSKS